MLLCLMDTYVLEEYFNLDGLVAGVVDSEDGLIELEVVVAVGEVGEDVLVGGELDGVEEVGQHGIVLGGDE